MMASQLAMNLIWGPERILIYNEVLSGVHGDKASSLPSVDQGAEVWGEVWEAAEAAIHHRVFAGETVTLEDQPWALLRNGGHEEAFFTSYFTPIRDETGAVVANLATAFGTTDAVKGKGGAGPGRRGLAQERSQTARGTRRDRPGLLCA